MSDAHAFLQDLAVVLCLAAITTVIFQRLRQPVVFGYIVAGMLVGPHMPISFAVDPATVRTLSELGVILLMFSLGLEFSFRRLLQVGSSAGLAALAETSLMLGLGFLAGRLLGWTDLESLFAGAIVAISSTTIIAKAFAEQKVQGRFKDIVLGILIFEDLIAILLVAVLTAVAARGSLSPGDFGLTIVRLATFLVALVGVGLFVVPRTVRAVVKLDRAETTLVASIGICFAAALLAMRYGYSVALGAFIAGSLVAASGEEKAVERLVLPVRDMFVAIFFVAVGMLIDPSVLAAHWGAVLVLILVVIAGKVVAVSAGTFLTGSGLRASLQSGMSLAQIGEFSFIIAAVGMASGATRPFLYPVAVAVSAITTLTTPWLIRAAGPVAVHVDRKLPEALQTSVALYGAWIEGLRRAPERIGLRARIRRLVQLIMLDAVLLAAVVIGAAAEKGRLVAMLPAPYREQEKVATAVVVIGAMILAAPLLVGLVRTARLLGVALAVRAMPAAREGRVDFAAAPRGVLVIALQFAILLAVVTPLFAITQPFVPGVPVVALLATIILLLALAFWRGARNLQGHARAGAQVIADALARQMAESREPESLHRTMEHAHVVLPGLGDPLLLDVTAESPAAGRTLAELNMRGITGATVLAIVREREQVLVPTGSETVRAGDELVVAGTHEAIESARRLIASLTPA